MPKFAANFTYMFNEMPFPDRFEAAARAGFKGVEYLFLHDGDPEYEKKGLAEKLDRHGLTQVLCNITGGDRAAGERGIGCLPDRVGEFQEGVGAAIEYAKALECKTVQCPSGTTPKEIDPALVRDTFVSNLRFAAAKLGQEGIRLVIEPVNTREHHGRYITTTAEALSIIEEVGSENLGIEHDLYHMQIMEGDLARTIEANLDRIWHVQVADNPGRHEPGTGEINYPFLFDLLDRLGYEGWIGCEYIPMSTTEDGLGWAAPYLTR